MYLLGDLIALTSGLIGLIYLVISLIKEKKGIYFQMIACAIGCFVLSYLYDVCEILTAGTLSEGFSVGYLGVIGCYLFLLSADYGCMDGIIDDGTSIMNKSRNKSRIKAHIKKIVNLDYLFFILFLYKRLKRFILHFLF